MNIQKIILPIYILSLFTYTLYANKPTELTTIQNQLNTKNAQYYSGQKLIQAHELIPILTSIDNAHTLTTDEKLYLQIDTYTLWAHNTIPLNTFTENYPKFKKIYQNLQNKDFKNGTLSSNLYTSFAEYANALLPLAKLTNDPHSYNFTVDSKEYLRLALLKDPTNTHAKVLYGMSILRIMDYSSYQKYKKSKTYLQNTDGLPEYMIFRTHIYKSMLYIKVNKIEKCFEELQKAENIYPNAPFVTMLKESYKEGGTGFSNSDRKNIANFYQNR